MVGGTIRRKVIHRESFRASVLHPSEIQAVLQSIAEKKCLLTRPSLLSRGTRTVVSRRKRRKDLFSQEPPSLNKLPSQISSLVRLCYSLRKLPLTLWGSQRRKELCTNGMQSVQNGPTGTSNYPDEVGAMLWHAAELVRGRSFMGKWRVARNEKKAGRRIREISPFGRNDARGKTREPRERRRSKRAPNSGCWEPLC